MRTGIRGWKLGHDTGLPGGPDVIFLRSRVAVFLDGCFWHGCGLCRSIPKTNRAFWATKLEGNRNRDKKANRKLKAIGWKVVRIWEHELHADYNRVLSKIL